MKTDVESCYLRYRDMVWRVALNHCESYAEAEDILQDVFLIYLKSDKSFNDETHRKAWLLRVTVNCCKSLYLSPWKKRCLPLSEIAGNDMYLSLSIPEREDYLELYERIAELKPLDRNLLQLFYFEDLPLATISEILGKTEGSLRTRLSRLRKKLAVDLKKGKELYEY